MTIYITLEKFYSLEERKNIVNPKAIYHFSLNGKRKPVNRRTYLNVLHYINKKKYKKTEQKRARYSSTYPKFKGRENILFILRYQVELAPIRQVELP